MTSAASPVMGDLVILVTGTDGTVRIGPHHIRASRLTATDLVVRRMIVGVLSRMPTDHVAELRTWPELQYLALRHLQTLINQIPPHVTNHGGRLENLWLVEEYAEAFTRASGEGPRDLVVDFIALRSAVKAALDAQLPRLPQERVELTESVSAEWHRRNWEPEMQRVEQEWKGPTAALEHMGYQAKDPIHDALTSATLKRPLIEDRLKSARLNVSARFQAERQQRELREWSRRATRLSRGRKK